MCRRAPELRWLVAGAAAVLSVALVGVARADGPGKDGGASTARPSPSLDWLPGRWRADADRETPELEFVWTKSGDGFHGELAEIPGGGTRNPVAQYDIAPAEGTWVLSLREEPGLYRFRGERIYDEYVRFKWKSSPPERARQAARARRSKAGRGGLGPLASSGAIAFVELSHTQGELFFRLVFGPVRRAPLERSYRFRPAAGRR
jgi:hypothetical protein